MTEEEKNELNSLLIYLDLEYMEKTGSLSEEGFRALVSMKFDYPNFDDRKYRQNLVKKIMGLINKEGHD